MECPKCKCPEGCGGELQLITENGVRYAKCDRCHRMYSRDDLQGYLLKNLSDIDKYGLQYSIYTLNDDNIKNNGKNIHTWVPGFRTGTPWKCVVASFGYCLMVLSSIGYIQEYAPTWRSPVRDIVALLLCIWLTPLVAADIGYFDRKISFLKNLPDPVRLIIRIFLCFLIFCIGSLLIEI